MSSAEPLRRHAHLMAHDLKPCKRCNLVFRPRHGNAKLCTTCKIGRVYPSGVSFGLRACAGCGRDYLARTDNQRFCSKRCTYRARLRDDRKYANPVHRGTRRRLVPLVATGTVRCARGGACRYAELVDGRLVGGFIRPGTAWHLGHRDSESAGGPEHVRCNTGAPSRLAAKRRRGLA